MIIRDIINWWRYDANYSLPDITAKMTIKRYAIAAVLTFGYSAASYPAVDAATGGDVTAFTATGAGLFWPLFWSWEFFAWLT